MTLLGDYEVIDLYGERTLLCHGDLLCTDDVNYQSFRKKVHQKWLQWLFLRLPLKVRLKIAQNIRAQSQLDKLEKTDAIMDVNPEFVLQTFERFGVKRMIHGHTHRQNIHQIPPHFERIVLGDWGKTASILEVSSETIQFIE